MSYPQDRHTLCRRIVRRCPELILCLQVPLPNSLGFCEHLPMVDSRDGSALRTLVGNVVAGLGSLTHKELNPASNSYACRRSRRKPGPGVNGLP